MSKKYLSLEEAAQQLGLTVEALNEYREKGDIRGFADRATWKFKVEDVENLGRSLQSDSAPEVPLLDNDDSIFDSLDDNDGDDATIVRPTDDDLLSASDSDVRLVAKQVDETIESDFDIPLLSDSDSDVRLVDEGGLLADSDSEVKLVGADSDSEVRLLSDDVDDQGHSDSDIRLIEDAPTGSPDSGLSLDMGGPAEGSGINLAAADSGISLEAADSGITLESPDSGTFAPAADSGITLESKESGITLSDDDDALMLAADSGIALEPAGSDDVYSTIPMLDASDDEESADQTMVEVPAMGGSDFEMGALDDDDDVLLDDGELSDATEIQTDSSDEYDLEEDFDDELEVADDDLIGEDDELDVFDADDDDFDDGFVSGASHSDFSAEQQPMVMAVRESDWGVGTFIGLILSSVLMSVCCIVVFDLVQSMWGWKEPNAFNSALLTSLRDAF